MTLLQRSLSFLSGLILLLFSPEFGAAQRATVSESPQTFRTYPFGDPDPVPRMGIIYPYFRYQGYARTPVERQWKVVTLENPYIRVLIAPEVGGKILGAFEKKTGRAFLYYNRVMKFRDIAMRGPWTSGGIEFNFGAIGHTPATATPVDYVTRTNADGSVSCIVGSLDLPSRTEWRVEIRLPRDKAYFETRSFWYNPTSMNTSLYHWMNAAVDADSDLQLLYPGTGYIGHGGEYSPWPIDARGRDLSLYKNNNFGSYKSYHVLGSYTDFYGVRWQSDDRGTIHWAPYPDKPGKKIWIWGLSREGEIWRNLLTDPELGNTQYVEIQSGLQFNQAVSSSSQSPFKHLALGPQSAERFAEVWYPFRSIGGLVEANLHGALNVQRTGTLVRLGFCPVERIDEELQVVTDNGEAVFRRRLRLMPLQAFVDSVTIPPGREFTVKVGSLIRYGTEDAAQRSLRRPTQSPPAFDWSSTFGLYTDGIERARQRDYDGALRLYAECLAKDSSFVPALAASAEEFIRRMEFGRATGALLRALAIDAYDPDANYLYGVVSRRTGRLYDALDGFGIASRSTKYRAAASLELAETYFVMKRFDDAERYARRTLEFDRMNVRALALRVLLSRVRPDARGTNAALAELVDCDPLNSFARWEGTRRGQPGVHGLGFASLVRGELPHETYLELAAYYVNLGLENEGLNVLSAAPSHPLVHYWAAYLLGRLGKTRDSRAQLSRAGVLSPELVLPHRHELLAPLLWARSAQPDWKPDYYLALLYWSMGHIDSAAYYFELCAEKPDWSPLYIARGEFLRSSNPGAAERDLRKALALSPAAWRPYIALIECLNDRGEYAEALRIAQEGATRVPGEGVLRFALARGHLLNGESAASLTILDTLTILPSEGARFGRELYRQSCIQEATRAIVDGRTAAAAELVVRARDWPERLGGGRPYDVDERLEDFISSVAFARLGDSLRRAEALERISEFTRSHPLDSSPFRLLSAVAARQTRNVTQGRSIIDAWPRDSQSAAIARWGTLLYEGKDAEARTLENGLRSSQLHRANGNQDFILLVDVLRRLGINALADR